MSIAPLTPTFGFGVTPGFGINPAYGVSATPPRTQVDLSPAPRDVTTFGELLSDKIAANGPLSSVQPMQPMQPDVAALDATDPMSAVQRGRTSAVARAGIGDLGGFVSGKLTELSAVNERSDKLAVAAATGQLKDIHEYTIAANEASVATQLAVSVRDKALQSFNDIIRMQL